MLCSRTLPEGIELNLARGVTKVNIKTFCKKYDRETHNGHWNHFVVSRFLEDHMIHLKSRDTFQNVFIYIKTYYHVALERIILH